MCLSRQGWSVLHFFACFRRGPQGRDLAKKLSGTPAERGPTAEDHSHSMVAGGFEEMSSATRLTSAISLMIRLETFSSRS